MTRLRVLDFIISRLTRIVPNHSASRKRNRFGRSRKEAAKTLGRIFHFHALIGACGKWKFRRFFQWNSTWKKSRNF